MPEYTPSAWIKPRDLANTESGLRVFSAWWNYREGKTSQSYKDIYLAATMVPPDLRSADIAEEFSMHIAKLRLKRQL